MEKTKRSTVCRTFCVRVLFSDQIFTVNISLSLSMPFRVPTETKSNRDWLFSAIVEEEQRRFQSLLSRRQKRWERINNWLDMISSRWRVSSSVCRIHNEGNETIFEAKWELLPLQESDSTSICPHQIEQDLIHLSSLGFNRWRGECSYSTIRPFDEIS